MAESTFGERMGFTCAAVTDLRACQYHIMQLTAETSCNIGSQAAAALGTTIGVLQNKPNSGEAAFVAVLGESQVVAGGAITVNKYITTNGSGRAAAAVSGDLCVGIALTAPGANGETFRALLFPPVPLLRT